MYLVVAWLMIFVSIFMVIVVLVQRSKGGGLAQNFASQTQVFGVRKSTDFVEKATWTLSILMLVLSLASVALLPKHEAGVADSGLDQLIQNSQTMQQQSPSFDTQPAESEQPAETPAN